VSASRATPALHAVRTRFLRLVRLKRLHELFAAADAELLVGVAKVGFDGPARDEERLGDLG
jgi:hypothetical protein